MSTVGNLGYPSVYQRLYDAQTEVIEQKAAEGACVIVGRCADYILRHREDCLHVFIHADDDHRAAHILATYGESDKSMAQRIKDKDSRRRNYYHFHTDRDWGAPSNYHMSLDSGILGVDLCVDLIVKAYEVSDEPKDVEPLLSYDPALQQSEAEDIKAGDE